MLQSRETGMPCPNCGNFIHVSLNQLLVMQPLGCSNCDTVLRMDRERSRDGLDALKVMKEVTDEKLGNKATAGNELKPIR